MFGFNGDLYIRKAVNSLSRVVNDVDTPVTGVGNYAPVVSALYDGVMYGVSSAMRVVVINNNNTATLVTPPSSNNVYGLRTGGASTSNGALFVCDTSFLLV
jgi:hypothetical protein